jgi:hypothetical protein
VATRSTTRTAADKTLESASLSAARAQGRWSNPRDLRITVTIEALSDVDLVKPVTFYADVRLHSDHTGFDVQNFHSAGPRDWEYDESVDRVRYFYSDDESVLVNDALVSEAQALLDTFVWDAVCEALNAYDITIAKALGL